MHKIALVQMASTGDIQLNRVAASSFIKEAKSKGASLVVLPECWATLGLSQQAILEQQEPYLGGPLQAMIAELAKKHQLWIIAGTLPIQSNDRKKPFASCLVFDNAGECQARYDKIHMFDVTVNDKNESYQESLHNTPGESIVVFDSPVGRIGLAICYDLRFPELFRAMNEQGAQILVIPSAFTIPTGQLHWEILNRVRAIENLSYVIAPNQCGERQNGHGTYGHSLAVDPWGEVIIMLDDQAGISIVNIDLNYLNKIRDTFPALSHRKLRSENECT